MPLDFRLAVRLLGIFATLLALASGANALPADKERPAGIQSRADLHEVARMPFWLRLGHYRSSLIADSGWRSYVDDSRFFLAPNGKHDPDAELQATLEAMFAPAGEDNAHVLCRYPLRTAWLAEVLAIAPAALPRVSCTDYEQWRGHVNASRVSLVFPSSYLGSPSSMYGHTLLRFDPADVDEGSDWLSWALNFGAVIRSDDNSLFFAYRGLAGGYPGLFSMMRYFEKIKEYRYMENRDMWEYRLNLTPAEIDRMLAHVWELRDIEFDYFFLDENCSFRLLELLELARPGLRLTARFDGAVIPVDTVRAVIDEALVDSQRFRPSEATLLAQRLARLSPHEYRLAWELTQDATALTGPDFESLPAVRRGEVVQVAYSHSRYEQRQQERQPEKAKQSFALLRALNATPSAPMEVVLPIAPDQGHGASVVGMGAGYRDEEFYTKVRWRYNYHELLDPVAGFQPGSAIVAGRVDVDLYPGGRVELDRLDVLEIVSLSSWNPFMPRLSWRIQAGYERSLVEEGRQGIYQVNGGAGITIAPASPLQLYALAEAALEHTADHKAWLRPGLGARAGYLWHTPLGVQQLEASGTCFYGDQYRGRLTLRQNWDWVENQSLRFESGVEYAGSHDSRFVELGYRYYF